MSFLFLKQLAITNLVTFKNEIITFHPGFNAIVGETGSGKSIILEALQLVLGARAEKKMIRKSAEYAMIEATFAAHGPEIKIFCEELGIAFDEEELIIKRIIYNNEKSKSYINYQTVPLQTIFQFSRRYIDLVGQFENQKLLSSDYQLTLLDLYSKNQTTLINYQAKYQALVSIKKVIEELVQKKQEIGRREDYLHYQITQIELLSPSIEEEVQLLARKKSIIEFHEQEKIIGHLQKIFSQEQDSIIYLLKKGIKLIDQLSVPSRQKFQDKSHVALNALEEISFQIDSFTHDHEDAQQELEAILDKLDRYQTLKRKLGGQTSDIIKMKADFQQELDLFEEIGNQLQLQQKQAQDLTQQLHLLAEQLHLQRQEAAIDLSKKLTQAVRKFKMDGATISFALEKNTQLNAKGISKLIFYAETNPGEGTYEVKSIASGGELSRILLALRRAVTHGDSISVFLFDEIDTGMGGETALAIGKALQEVAQNSQVIAITHLPQMMKFADQLLKVDKEQIPDGSGQLRTISKVQGIGKKPEKRSP